VGGFPPIQFDATAFPAEESKLVALLPSRRVSKWELPGVGPLRYYQGVAPVLLARPFFGFNPGGMTMEWTTPQHEVVDLNCEVSSYANAEL
jgi:hypothetical protein